ncbi:hypothetical protein P168DRAFT_286614 [Aspergillus campestris IBT 28561]|uniref:Uncharacterized protein n=1 Tax=Aspergillus campestris (strain IBT 28561) TaxID=1392248 RepID=A0A2I1DF45_ASPC2|nr:uncharacterized protein P168DRAFT_286614 [Aspergillus campestris IBT 28561]PKY08499.1 hypothetical protein P168DRAFT_286614 [Aspergillus campestris IBT 28561]
MEALPASLFLLGWWPSLSSFSSKGPTLCRRSPYMASPNCRGERGLVETTPPRR